eukprot:gnl/TRDRNA2_/TRDRNA2_165387_c0_seq1.p1 gnl/TRDRNA2_/TRDRNA2_165387_c0~~gnl/TRDRNA2_/TRDRNA2_165387_c0_seq1.p1  ORF type:complete len:167 (+),score=9.85 gnl/TRDRNA2_/TRDRNA2_165387_c0_seq1:53-502(+)
MYDEQRYEVETKYSTYVDITERGVLPRVEMAVLAEMLNTLETQSDQSDCGRARWGANRITDSGPILRLDLEGRKLDKAERYGHPFERPIYSSGIAPATFSSLVTSYFEHAYAFGEKQVQPKARWKWDELHEFNRCINWTPWIERHSVIP